MSGCHGAAAAPDLTAWHRGGRRGGRVEQSFVDIVIFLLENIEYHFFKPIVCLQEIADCLYRNFGRLFLQKMKFSCGNTAKGNAFQFLIRCQFQTGSITVCKLVTMLFCQSA